MNYEGKVMARVTTGKVKASKEEKSHSTQWEREAPPPPDLQLQPFLPRKEKLCRETEPIFGHFIAKVKPQIDTYISFAWRWTC